jgi:DNA-binding PucR family transcriptional regulator
MSRADIADAPGWPHAAIDRLLQSLRLSATLRVYLEENMSPSRVARRLGVHEHKITNRIRAAQDLLPYPIEERSCELEVALRLIRLAQGAGELS